MQPAIEDYAFISDSGTGALVSNRGSIDWCCLPRFDSGACFAALLGDEDHGRWQICPERKDVRVRRAYRPGTLILETEFLTNDGVVRLIDFMPQRHVHPTIVRIVEGVSGSVDMCMDLAVRFDYGWVVPWVFRDDEGMLALIAGPDSLNLRTPVDLQGKDNRTGARFRVAQGDRVPFVLSWHDTYAPPAQAHDAEELLQGADRQWREWSGQCRAPGKYQSAITESLVVLKGLVHERTGGVVAAATTSLPEELGGVRNWDYRFTWLRDASMTMKAFARAGYLQEAREWRDWLLTTVAGDPRQLQIMYGIDGTRRLTELEIDWLPGYRDSRPVRIGNRAVEQVQLDVTGEVMEALHWARKAGIPPDERAWGLQEAMLETLADHWSEPDHGIWEVRGEKRHFVHSKVMAWVAADRAAQAIRSMGLPGDAGRWEGLARVIHDEVMEHGWNSRISSFVQYYGADTTDASLLQLPLVGFLPPGHERMIGTVRRVEDELVSDGFVQRYLVGRAAEDGLAGDEGAFLICSFWLAQVLARQGRTHDATEILERILDVRNDVGLLAEEYDPKSGRMLGNFPQAFSHIGLVNAASACSAPASGDDL